MKKKSVLLTFPECSLKLQKTKTNLGYANVTENFNGLFYLIILCKHYGNIIIECSLTFLKQVVTFKEF